MKVKIYQTTSTGNGYYFDMWKEISNDLPFYSVLEGTKYMYLIAIPSSIDPTNIFQKYDVETLEPEEKDFDDDKFNSSYQITITYGGEDYYILEKPFKYCHNINCIKVNDDGYPVDENNVIIEGTQKLYPVNHGNPYYHEPIRIAINMIKKLQHQTQHQ
jgi:hypothetical protein